MGWLMESFVKSIRIFLEILFHCALASNLIDMIVESITIWKIWLKIRIYRAERERFSMNSRCLYISGWGDIFASSRMKVEKIAIHRTYYARLWWLFSLMYSWQRPGHVINTEESMDTLLGSSRYSMGKALTSGPHHRSVEWFLSFLGNCGITTRREVVFIVLSRFDFSSQLLSIQISVQFLFTMAQKCRLDNIT